MSAIPVESDRGIDEDNASAVARVAEGQSGIDRWLLKWTDWLNPILVKETRQALQGKQFLYTFGIVLLAVAGWTVLFISLTIPGVYYIASGQALLMGYLCILIVPTCIVVPSAAFRSMASELEDGTFDMLSLSTIRPQQIVNGKLAVAALQSILYFSVMAPCIAMTYLLRGVSLGSLVIILPGTFMLSVAGSALGILIASATQARFAQVMTLLIHAIGMIGISVGWLSLCAALLFEEPPLDQWQFWAVLVTFLVFVASYLCLFQLSTAANIGLASENYTTLINKLLVLQHVCFFGVWIATTPYVEYGGEQWSIAWTVASIHWAIVGMLTIGQSGIISQRARRSLPSNGVSRLFLSWFNPGAGASYVLIVLTLFATMLFMLVKDIFPETVERPSWSMEHGLETGVHITAYFALYLGLARLLVLLISGGRKNNVILSSVIVIFLVLAGTLAPILISFWANSFSEPTYEFYTVSNPFWTLVRIWDNDTVPVAGSLLLCGIAAVIFLINLQIVSRDVMLVRVVAPPRVREEVGSAPSELAAEESVNPFAD